MRGPQGVRRRRQCSESGCQPGDGQRDGDTDGTPEPSRQARPASPFRAYHAPTPASSAMSPAASNEANTPPPIPKGQLPRQRLGRTQLHPGLGPRIGKVDQADNERQRADGEQRAPVAVAAIQLITATPALPARQVPRRKRRPYLTTCRRWSRSVSSRCHPSGTNTERPGQDHLCRRPASPGCAPRRPCRRRPSDRRTRWSQSLRASRFAWSAVAQLQCAGIETELLAAPRAAPERTRRRGPGSARAQIPPGDAGPAVSRRRDER